MQSVYSVVDRKQSTEDRKSNTVGGTAQNTWGCLNTLMVADGGVAQTAAPRSFRTISPTEFRIQQNFHLYTYTHRDIPESVLLILAHPV
jgi:hypothetical protein